MSTRPVMIEDILNFRPFTDERLNEKMDFSLCYILKNNSQRFVPVVLRNVEIDMGNQYYGKFCFWFSKRNDGI